jgi:hypothetical protein
MNEKQKKQLIYECTNGLFENIKLHEQFVFAGLGLNEIITENNYSGGFIIELFVLEGYTMCEAIKHIRTVCDVKTMAQCCTNVFLTISHENHIYNLKIVDAQCLKTQDKLLMSMGISNAEVCFDGINVRVTHSNFISDRDMFVVLDGKSKFFTRTQLIELCKHSSFNGDDTFICSLPLSNSEMTEYYMLKNKITFPQASEFVYKNDMDEIITDEYLNIIEDETFFLHDGVVHTEVTTKVLIMNEV